jgi:hypothetical protein
MKDEKEENAESRKTEVGGGERRGISDLRFQKGGEAETRGGGHRRDACATVSEGREMVQASLTT